MRWLSTKTLTAIRVKTEPFFSPHTYTRASGDVLFPPTKVARSQLLEFIISGALVRLTKHNW